MLTGALRAFVSKLKIEITNWKLCQFIFLKVKKINFL